jgi:AsmA protein
LASERVQRRLTAIVAADVAGYSRLMGADEEGTLAQLKAHQSEIIDPKINEYRGRIVKTTGDGMLVEFTSVVDAVRCAAEVQHAMISRNADKPVESRIEFRVGVHVGDIIIDGNDIYGDGVNIAARLEGISTPGGICVSSAVRDEVQDKVELPFEYAGEQVLKNIARPVRVYRIGLTAGSIAGLRRGFRKPSRKAFKIVIAAVAAAVVLLLIFGIPANFLVGTVESRVQADSGYRLRIYGGTTVSFFPSPTVTLRDISLFHGDEAGPQDQFRADRVSVMLSFSDLVSGHTKITQVTISHPTLRVALLRKRVPPAAAPTTASAGPAKSAPSIDRVVIEDGTVGFYSSSDRLESSIDHLNLEASPGSADAPPTVKGSLSAGGQVFQIALKSQVLPQRLEGQTIPIELTMQAPGLWNNPLDAKAELRSRGSSLAINALSGQIGKTSFNGYATVDFAAIKPVVKADIDFNQLHLLPLADSGNVPRRSALNEPWSDQKYDFDGLNFVDADVQVSASDFSVGSFRMAPIAVETNIANGVLQAKFVNTKLYGGGAAGGISLDASGSAPTQAINVRLDDVDALSLFSDVAQFDSLEGTMQATINVNATGASERAAISTLAGTVTIALSNGAVRGIDVAKLMHNLTNTILNGWQEDASDKTPLTDFNATFQLANGVATTDDLMLSGPVARMTGAGSIDLAAKTLQLKVDPRLVAGHQNSSDSDQATGLGVPVRIEGSWGYPRIYPDVAGILNDPNGIYSQLKAAGKGLFGDSSQSGNNGNSGTFNNLLQGLGKMLNAPASNRRGVSGSDQ